MNSAIIVSILLLSVVLLFTIKPSRSGKKYNSVEFKPYLYTLEGKDNGMFKYEKFKDGKLIEVIIFDMN